MQKLLKVALCSLVLFNMLAVTGICFGIRAQAGDRLSISDTPITVNFQNSLLRAALEEIREKSGLGITYNDSDLPEGLRLSYRAQNIPVKEVLQQLLKDTRLTFKEYKGNLIIYIREQEHENRSGSTGSLQGTLSDAETGEPLIGATALIIGTNMGGSTDVEGRYSIINVPEGNYDLGISFIGYETAIVRNIKILPGQITTVDYKLKISTTQLQDIEIIGNKALSGNVIETNEVAMVNEIRTSSLIVTGISAEQISRSVDQDAGQVARRLPGVAVLNNFVNIRGMHERYNLTYLNGMVAPSSETDTRAFSYDLLPSGMIDKMMVYRSPAPELLADWAGGVIKIETKNSSIARQIEINFSTWFRPGSSGEDYYSYAGGKTDWLGQDDGTRTLPGGFPPQGQIPPSNTPENSALGRRMYNKWSLQKARYGLDYRGGVNYYDAWNLGKMRLSNLTSLSTTQAMQIINQDFVPTEKGYDKEGFPQAGRYFKDTISQVQARWSAVQNLTLQINARHRLEAKGIFNQLASDETMVRDGFDELGSDLSQYGYQTRIIYTYRSRAVLATQLAGNHSMGDNDRHTIQWAAGYGYSKDDIPAQRMLSLSPDINQYNNAQAPRYVQGGDPTSVLNGHYNTSALENNYTFSLDYTHRLPRGLFLKAGGFNEIKERDQDARFIKFNGMPFTDSEGHLFTQWNADEMFSPERYREDGSGIYITEGGLSGLFNVRSNLIGVYSAVNIPLFNNKLNIYGGIRYEGQQLLQTQPDWLKIGEELVNTDRYLFYWLPSVNVSWNLTDKILLRGAYGKTLNRPNFREMMPHAVRDFRLDRLFIGDSSLVDAEVHNFDLRWEYYPAEGEFISAGAFYKKLSNAIEPYVEVFGASERIYFNNTPKAIVYGVEAEVRKSLSMLPWRWAQKFSVISNLALLRSEAKFQDSLFSHLNSDFRVFTRPLEGTASYVVNAGVYFDHEALGTKISVLYNVLGQRLVLAPTANFPAYYELPRHAVDISFRQRITKHLELRAGVQDVLNQAVRRYADYDRNEYWSRHERNKWPYKDWIFQQFKPGRYFTLGVNLSL